MKTASFEAKELDLPGVLLITPTHYDDVRGYSLNTYDAEEFKALGIESTFIHGYASHSAPHVIRGLHYQRPPFAQDKLVRVVAGKIMDVVADIDRESSHFGKHISQPLSASAPAMLYIPGRYAHAFCTLDDGATVEYLLSNVRNEASSAGARYDDPVLAISWPTTNPILSEQDKAWPPLKP